MKIEIGWAISTAFLLGLPGALAQSHTGPNIYTIAQYDSKTGANRSVVVVQAKGLSTDNALVLRCTGQGSFNLFLKTTTTLLTQKEFQKNSLPYLYFNVDDHKGVMATARRAYNTKGTPDLKSLTFTPAGSRLLHEGLVEARVLSVMVIPEDERELNYVFPAMGYIAAFDKVKRCR